MLGTNPTSQDLSHIDVQGFAAELRELRKSVKNEIGEKDLRHAKKIEWWVRACSWLGYLTAWIIPNPISALLIAEGAMGRWCILSHHIMHKGYDRVQDAPKRFQSKHYAKGWRRYLDWFDWHIPAAWDYEHNELHHYHTGEMSDPDLAEETFTFMRESKLPRIFKYMIIFFFMCTWKFTYYAPNTLIEYKEKQKRKGKSWERTDRPSLGSAFNPFKPLFWELMFKSYLPYFGLRFVLIPAAFLVISPTAALFVLINSVLAEIICNIHTFLNIVPNHAGEDIYRFDTAVKDKNEFLVRQVVGSVNYKTGGELNDYLHGWLNYQIEHHLFPDLPASKYSEIQPKVMAICEKYGVPYIQESVFSRFKHLVNVLTGKETMIRVNSLANSLKPELQPA